MSRRIILTPDDRCRLARTRQKRKGKISERCLYVLMNAEGQKVKEIADMLHSHSQTIRYWLNVYRTSGLHGLKGKKPPGRPNDQRHQAYDLIKSALAQSATRYGFVQEGWTVGMLLSSYSQRLHLQNATKTVGNTQLITVQNYEVFMSSRLTRLADLGHPVSRSTLTRALKQNHWRYKRFAKTVATRAPNPEEKRHLVADMVAHIQREHDLEHCEVLFLDESHFTNNCYVQRGWFYVGTKVTAPTPVKRESVSIIGALSLSNFACFWRQGATGNSDLVISFFRQLHQNLPGTTLIIIADNSSIHRSRKVQRFLRKHPWVHLYFLPPYSPEYNPIERFWLWLKQKVYGNQSFTSIYKVVKKIRSLLWHYNRWTLDQTIIFQFKPYLSLLI